LLAAFDGAKMVGFVFGFLGMESEDKPRQLKHCSHMLAVLPAYRARGLALELKKAQREYLLAQGLELATWTYDPLQAVNAALNLARLGGLVRRYLRDAYGEMSDALNAGVASDRFEVEWWLDSPRVRAQLARPDAGSARAEGQLIYRVEFGAHDLPRIAAESECAAKVCRVEIPADFNLIKARDLSLARAWRTQTRATFERAFASGYRAVDVANWQDARGRRRAAYVLERTSADCI
jgi:predicted GNAT superfamily acetyltransferase